MRGSYPGRAFWWDGVRERGGSEVRGANVPVLVGLMGFTVLMGFTMLVAGVLTLRRVRRALGLSSAHTL